MLPNLVRDNESNDVTGQGRSSVRSVSDCQWQGLARPCPKTKAWIIYFQCHGKLPFEFWDLLKSFQVIRHSVEHVLVFDSFSRLKRRFFKWWNGFGASFCIVLAWVRYDYPRLFRDNANKATGTGDITGYFSFLLILSWLTPNAICSPVVETNMMVRILEKTAPQVL